MKVRWVCGCPLCRILVHPILSSISSIEPTEQSHYRETEEVPREHTLEQVVAEVEPQPPEESKTTSSSANEVSPTPQLIEVKVPEEVMERISKLEDEIKRVRDELSAVSEGLRNAVIEFKEVIAEASSPFSILKKNGNGNGRSKANGAHRIAPSTFVELLRVIDSMLNEMDKDTVIALLSGYFKAGIISEAIGSSLLELVELAYTMKSKGISVEKQIPYLYALAQALRIEDQSLTAILLKEMIKRGGLG
ncbi:MAG: hypothetical protein QXQ35_08415 [Candidatus Nezhaarchaeales archaeon]